MLNINASTSTNCVLLIVEKDNICKWLSFLRYFQISVLSSVLFMPWLLEKRFKFLAWLYLVSKPVYVAYVKPQTKILLPLADCNNLDRDTAK